MNTNQAAEQAQKNPGRAVRVRAGEYFYNDMKMTWSIRKGIGEWTAFGDGMYDQISEKSLRAVVKCLDKLFEINYDDNCLEEEEDYTMNENQYTFEFIRDDEDEEPIEYKQHAAWLAQKDQKALGKTAEFDFEFPDGQPDILTFRYIGNYKAELVKIECGDFFRTYRLSIGEIWTDMNPADFV